MKAEIRSKMGRAEHGKLAFGKDRDVNQMTVAPIILELRVRKNAGTPKGDRVVRLYFCEPAHIEGMLLAAKLGWKPPQGKKEQNEQALEAEQRVRAYFT